MMGRLSRRRGLFLAGLLTLFLLLATVYNGLSTPFEAPDEIGHFYYVVHLIQTGELPVVPAEGPNPNFEHEGAQPPLYYWSASVVVRALSHVFPLTLEDADASLGVNPYSACAQPGARYNTAYFERYAYAERFPYQGRVRVLHVVRLWSSVLAAATVAGVYHAVRLAFPESPRSAWLAAGLGAFTPEFLFTAGAVSNDTLVTALATWGLVLALRALRDGVRWRDALAFGALSGLAALSKVSGALLLPFFLLVTLMVALRSSGQAKSGRMTVRLARVAALGCLTVLTFAAVAGWWFYRNWMLYGDLTGTTPIVLVVRQGMTLPELLQELVGVFRSWWGAFGCTAPPEGFHVLYMAIAAGGLAGLIAGRRSVRRRWPQVALLLVWFGLVFAAFFRWNWTTYAPHGRLLYPAYASVAGLLGRGLGHWAERRRGLGYGTLAVLVVVAVAVPFAVMAPPTTPPVILAHPADAHIGYPFQGRFGTDIALLGYDLSATSVEPSEAFDVTLYWQALTQPSQHHTLAIQLVSAVPGETSTLVNLNTWTGRGNYPTGNWRPGDVIVDEYVIEVPGAVPRTQGWYLRVILFDPTDGVRVPFTPEGRPAGDGATLALIRVGCSACGGAHPEGDARIDPPAIFGDAVALEGLDLSRRETDLQVTLWWRSRTGMASDLVVFAHLYDADGQLIATADGPVLGGGFPTSRWKPDDLVVDRRSVSLAGSAQGPFQLGVGWYDPTTGTRLGAVGPDGAGLPDGELLTLAP